MPPKKRAASTSQFLLFCVEILICLDRVRPLLTLVLGCTQFGDERRAGAA